MDHPFAKSPFLVFWETTRACDLACLHCRACAIPQRDPRELTYEEGCTLLGEIRALGCPMVVLTGGDPAKREDLADLVRHGSALGLRMALTPSATPLLDDALLRRLQAAGLSRLAMSLDSAAPTLHDSFRGVTGSYQRTIDTLQSARTHGLSTQMNTTISPHNVDELAAIAALARDLAVTLWSVFLLVPTGRGADMATLAPERVERALLELAAIAREAPFDVKTTAAPQFRRVLLQQKVARSEIAGLSDGIGRAPRGVNDGQGVAFVSHTGDIYPSGFLPISCGNVRGAGLTRTYRTHPLFLSLRDPEQLTGKCGECEFKRVCGGSRARAHAVFGSPLAYDPACDYLPKRTLARMASEAQQP